jgi:predicted DNA-binding protein
MEVKRNRERHMKKVSAISIRVPDTIKEAADKKAREDARTLASYVYKLLVDDLQASGHIK